jgi:hypothetical protein
VTDPLAASSPPSSCPACASQALSPRGEYNSFDNHARFSGLGVGRRGRATDLKLKPTHARVCLDCGYMLLFVAGKGLTELIEGTSGSTDG